MFSDMLVHYDHKYFLSTIWTVPSQPTAKVKKHSKTDDDIALECMDMDMLALDNGAPKSLQEAKDRDNFGIKTGPDGKSLWIPPPDT